MIEQIVASPPEVDRRLPRYLALRDHLYSKIAAGGWDFNKPLPPESKLAKQYSVALGTMRRAIEELVREGILDRRHGSGVYIRRSDFSGSLSRFLRFRSSHSTIAFQESRVLAVRLDTPPQYARQGLQLKEGDAAIFIDRRRYHDNELLVVEKIWVPSDRFEPLLSMPLEEIGPLMYRTYETHCAQLVARAVESLKIIVADPETAAILEIDPGGPALAIDRTTYDFADRPIEWRRSHAKADHFEYRIEIR